MAGGAPRKWKSVKAMQKAIDAYFESCKGTPLMIDGDVATDKYGRPIILDEKPPTAAGGIVLLPAVMDTPKPPEDET